MCFYRLIGEEQEEELDECVVRRLLNSGFGSRNNADQMAIVKEGRPMPSLPNVKSKNKTCTRKFHEYYYNNITWLTGCHELNKLFCWPCLLFNNDKTVWNKAGYNDMNNFDTAWKRHENKCKNHGAAVLALEDFKQNNVYHQVNQQHAANIKAHNIKVDKNRDLLKRLIDTVLYLATQELAFRGHREGKDSSNKGNYLELLDLISKYDHELREHLDKSTLFTGTSNHIQNDIIQSIANVLLKAIDNECVESEFISFMMDEASDTANKSQLTKVARICRPDGAVKERFRGFEDVSADRSAPALFQVFKKEVTTTKSENKVVGQAYDGARVMSGTSSGLQTLVKAAYPHAFYIHCCAHVLNLVLFQVCKQISQCKIFFINMESFASFFSVSTKRSNFMEKYVNKKLPKPAPTRWCYKSRLLNTIEDNRDGLIMLFTEMNDNSEVESNEEIPIIWDKDDRTKARGFLSYLEDFHFMFLLKTFSIIFDKTDKLFALLQKKGIEIGSCIKSLGKTLTKIENFKQNFEQVYNDVTSITGPPTKRTANSKESYQTLFENIHDVIIKEIKVRYAFLESLKFIDLMESSNFKSYDETGFPDGLLENLRTTYGDLFDMSKLRNELEVIYTSESSKFYNNTVAQIYKNLCQNQNLSASFIQVKRLCSLILTLPSTTASAERTFSALKRIKTYLRNTMGQTRLSALALISIEQELLKDISSKSNFYDLVIEEFIEKDRRAEFHYKY